MTRLALLHHYFASTDELTEFRNAFVAMLNRETVELLRSFGA